MLIPKSETISKTSTDIFSLKWKKDKFSAEKTTKATHSTKGKQKRTRIHIRIKYGPS